MTEPKMDNSPGLSDNGAIFGGRFKESDHYLVRRPDGMRDTLLFYTLDGQGYIQTPGTKLVTGQGDIALLPGGFPHEYGTVQGRHWHFMWVHIPDTRRLRNLPESPVTLRHFHNPRIRRRIFRIFRNLLQDSREQRGLWRELCENNVQELLFLMSEDHRRQVDPRIDYTLQQISRHMSDPFRIADLASAVGLSESRLSHLFKEETGETIISVVNRLRIRQAALYIAYSGRTATQAALDVGFQNYNHFASLFVKQFGVKPSVYARQTR